jgi:hypothetical protein
MQSAEKLKTPLTLILSPRRGEVNSALGMAMFAWKFTTVVRLSSGEEEREGEELIVI